MLSRVETLRVDIWSDIACPWCYVGKRRLETALGRFSHPGGVSVVWRAFELDPSAPRERDRTQSYAERLARKYGFSVGEGEARLENLTRIASAEGLSFRFDRVRSGNTFDAHRVLHLAARKGAQGAVKERFLRAYMTEGEPIGDPETLVRLSAEAGLDPSEVRAALASDAHAREVRDDEEEAKAHGIGGVPFFVIAGRYAVSGAQPAEILLQALRRAASELAPRPPATADGAGAAASCDADGCEVP
jgi:predicted DsbA family dithiol-disulfide isomerase